MPNSKGDGVPLAVQIRKINKEIDSGFSAFSVLEYEAKERIKWTEKRPMGLSRLQLVKTLLILQNSNCNICGQSLAQTNVVLGLSKRERMGQFVQLVHRDCLS